MKRSFTFLCALMITVGCGIRHHHDNHFPDQSASPSPSAIRNNDSPDKISFMGMNIIFEDESLTDELKTPMIADYKSVLARQEPKGSLRIGPIKLEINGADITITNKFGFSAEHITTPANYWHEFGIIGRCDNGQEFLVITRTLSNGYKSAMELRETYNDAFRSLPAFVALINNMDKELLPSVDNLMYFVGDRAAEEHAEMMRTVNANDELRKQFINKFVDAFGGYHYALCNSILECELLDERPAVPMWVLDKESGKRIIEMYAIFDQGRWKMLIPLL